MAPSHQVPLTTGAWRWSKISEPFLHDVDAELNIASWVFSARGVDKTSREGVVDFRDILTPSGGPPIIVYLWLVSDRRGNAE